MRDLLGRLPLGLAASAGVGATVVAFACGSSSVGVANDVGKPLRWAALLVLLVVAAAWAARERRPIRLPAAAGAAVAFLAVALVSTAWSVDPRLTFERTASLGLLFLVAALLAYASADRRDSVELVLGGLLAGAAAVGVAGLVVLAADYDTAVEPATRDLPARFRGFGENPNTASLLFALALPIAAWLALRHRSWRARGGAAGLALLFVGSIAAASSRGALVAGFAASFVVVALAPVALRTRAAVGAVLAVLLGASIGGATFADANPDAPPAAAIATAERHGRPAPGYTDWEALRPLAFEIGPNQSKTRSFLGSSGRSQAWDGALDQAVKRPIAGYGFGTERDVFVDRYSQFAGDLPENSYIGLDLQLGGVGLVAFLVLAALVLWGAVRRRRPEAVVCGAVFVAGLMLAFVQSYVYSVGNIGSATVWISGFLGSVVGAQER